MDSLATQYREIIAKIAYYATKLGLNEEELAAIAHLSKATWQRRKNVPGSFTIEELGMLSRKFNVNIANILQGVDE